MTPSISDACKSFTISAESSLGWGWIRGPGTELSCTTTVWPCQERSLSNVLGASPALLPPGLPQLPSSSSRHADPSKDEAHVGHRVTGHSRFMWAFCCPSLAGGIPTLVVLVSQPITINFVYSFHQPWFRRIFLRLVGLNHNQRSELKTKFLAALCFILSYFPSASLSFILAQSIIFLTDHTWYIIYFRWINPLDKAWWSKYQRKTQKTSGICFSLQPIHHFKMYCQLNW